MLGVWRPQGSSLSNGNSRPSADDPGYVQLSTVEDGEKEAIAHGQPEREKMAEMSRRAASASSDNIPLLLDKEKGHVELQLADVEDEVPPAPRRLEEVPLVGAPAVEEDEATNSLSGRIGKAVFGHADAAELEQLRKDLASLPPDEAERILTTGWGSGSTIHLAAGHSGVKYRPATVEVFEVLLHNRRHLLNLKDMDGRTPLHHVANTAFMDGERPLHYVAKEGGGAHLVKKFIEWGGKDLLKAQDKDGRIPLHSAAGRQQEGHTLLHIAAEANSPGVVQVLIAKYPDLLEKWNAKDETPFDVAIRLKCGKAVGAMLAAPEAKGIAMEWLVKRKAE
ncbi:unnamed protein product [Vitrella brassicaformis CCMP3155]|uniref:Uncharacterized protein n=1 Tax=Vitrella brassicaformis (strain CCMP3155) TaxID=1169540 RepID=A0A0G4F530_VITBC|nr:unnamed protein product [Vitrella brassicaformis CCMP3155]|eukprot:CEM06932.1 unnamed protein product [Vitrella brassicaformis CCMP3155]